MGIDREHRVRRARGGPNRLEPAAKGASQTSYLILQEVAGNEAGPRETTPGVQTFERTARTFAPRASD
jgi:hypothetical protein